MEKILTKKSRIITEKIIYTGPIDQFYNYCYGELQYRSVRFENEILYPVPEEGTIYIAEDYGISQDNETNTGTINLFLQSLKTVEGNKIIKFNSR